MKLRWNSLLETYLHQLFYQERRSFIAVVTDSLMFLHSFGWAQGFFLRVTDNVSSHLQYTEANWWITGDLWEIDERRDEAGMHSTELVETEILHDSWMFVS